MQRNWFVSCECHRKESRITILWYRDCARCKEVSEIRTELISDRVKIEQKSVLNIKDNLMFDKIFCDYPWGIKAKDSIGSNEALQAIYDEIPEVQKVAAGDWIFIINVMNHLNKMVRLLFR